MKFTIENGKDICAIGLSDIGSYIRFNYPITVVWYDCRGSVGKYFCTLPYNEEYRKSVEKVLTNNLNNDFSGKSEELYEILKPLLPIFRNGTYSLSFFSNKEKEFFQYKSSYDKFKETHYYSLEVVFANKTTDVSNLEKVKDEHKYFLKENAITKKYYDSEILEFTTSAIYTGDESFYATQPFEKINQNRVKYFEEKIKNGERPFAILFNACLEPSDYNSSYYILDGHHKLLAYQNLGQYPPIALITYLPKSIDEIEFDAEKLSEMLYPWQIEHILKHWEGKDEYIARILKNPDSNLHTIVKNGDYKEYHENGRLKHQAFYNNDKIDGCLKEWYNNGQLKSEHYYNKGIRIGNWTDYYQSGKIQFIQPYNELGLLNGILVSFFENGQERMRQELENGRNKDGVSYQVWFENGDKDSELTYKNGQMVVRKNWNSWGEFVNHEVFNEETKKLEKIDIPENEKYVFDSKNYKHRQAEIKEIVNGMRKRKDANMENSESGLWSKIKRLFK